MQPKSILKKTVAPPVNGPPGTKPVDQRHLQVALHHANILEQRKQVEAAVLDSIMTLMEYPTVPGADPKRPSAADAQYLRDAMIPFQPTDYDSLIEERNIGGKCGYALCPRPKSRARSTARKQFVDTDHGVEIVDRQVLEVWCSDDCAKRALYIKVQLSEEPAWMRQGGCGDKIDLMVDSVEEQHKALPVRLKREAAQPAAKEGDDDDVADAWALHEDAMKDLALERGERPGGPSKAVNNLIQDQVKERMPDNKPPQAPSKLALDSEHTMAIEGHVPRIDKQDEDGEEDDNDWEKHFPA